MKYNYKGIGSRISKERKAAGFKSQQAFIDYLQQKYGYSIGRNTLSAIENGNTGHYDCELLYILCDIFNCEMGYLLCEYECKTGRNTDIAKETGLNESAIIKLSDMNFENSASGFSDILTLLINNPNFIYMLALLSNNAAGACDTVSFGNVTLKPDRRAIINSELKDIIIKIASDIRSEYKPNENSILYGFIYGLYAEKRITLEQLQDIKEEYDKGNFEYIPESLKNSNI